MFQVSSPELDDNLASSGLRNHDASTLLAFSQSPELSDNVTPSLLEPLALWDLTGDTNWSTLVSASEELPPPRCLSYVYCILSNVFKLSPILGAESPLTDELAIINMHLGSLTM
ncbi:hypothetical protein DICSQDRAFT_175016 [Dichomitus squalens LYAD-421 SS1]|uniref:Uncharacterized protein n=1 Tax=Dichomitus squalens (strain LYAD-421) TaxID=732165 RepID=R7SKA5_DICSQ|nr:uncharacterized protein DICSQDRAFT_175016 [Dichomitus squalens LYAD-421 SS1]EJF56278.1 hypothetical protein DICSQDRAFT_175016 [Dichomitus squalens LYAD-421 SS1]